MELVTIFEFTCRQRRDSLVMLALGELFNVNRTLAEVCKERNLALFLLCVWKCDASLSLVFDMSYGTEVSSMSFMNQSDVFPQDKFGLFVNQTVVLDLLSF